MQSHSSRDTFLYLLQFVTLAIAATALGNVWFALVDRWIVAPSPHGEFYPGAITGGLSALVVASPAYLVLSWWIRKQFTGGAMDPGSSLRRWLVYFTLFVTAIIGLTDLIALLNTYLNGDFTLRFFFKALSVLFIAGTVFGFYFWDIRREHPVATRATRNVLFITVIVVLATIISGFWVVGSPKTRRLLEWDRQRVESLRAIALDLSYRAASKDRPIPLPADQSRFFSDFSYLPIADPETGVAFEFYRIDTSAFQLCATFARAAESSGARVKEFPRPVMGPEGAPLDTSKIERHGAGRQCFDFSIL